MTETEPAGGGAGGGGGKAGGQDPARLDAEYLDAEYLDGNAIGGALGEVFAVDVTAAVGQCASCGTSSVIGQARVYPSAPGVIARCPACAEITVRLVRGADRAWLDLRGISCLEVALPPAP